MKRTVNEKRGGGAEKWEIVKEETHSVSLGNITGGYEGKKVTGWEAGVGDKELKDGTESDAM